MTFEQFLLWERSTRDVIAVRKTYIDMAGDLAAGVLLSQLVYWYLPDKEGYSKLRVYKDGYYWIAKARTDWWDECRLTPKQVDRVIRVLEEKGIIHVCIYKFDGVPTTHIRIDTDRFMDLLGQILEGDITQRDNSMFPKGEDGNDPKGKIEITQRGKSITETTTETTTEITSESTNTISLVDDLGVSYTKVPNEDNLPRSSWGRVDDDTPPLSGCQNSFMPQRGPLSEKTDKPVTEWKAPDLVRYFIRKWENVYGQKHPKINWAIQGRHMKQFLLDVYGPERSKTIIDEFFKRRAEFESREYPTIGLHGLRQEWIIRKLIPTANMASETKKRVRLYVSEYRAYQQMLGEDLIPDRDAYVRNKGYDPDKYDIEWVED